MSRIYFHTKDGEAEVYGSERAYMGVFISDLTLTVLKPLYEVKPWEDDKEPRILEYLSDECYLKKNFRSHAFNHEFEVFLSVGGMAGEEFILDDKKIPIFTLCLNTAFVVGSDPIRLYVRIHGQCEIHGYVLPENLEWFAKIIKQGIETKIFRSNSGWESVLELVQNTEDSPVVMSYSVTDGFPNSYIADWHDEHEGDDWYDLSRDDRWNLGIKGLIEQNKNCRLEITPEDWVDFRFRNGVTAFDFLEHVAKTNK